MKLINLLLKYNCVLKFTAKKMVLMIVYHRQQDDEIDFVQEGKKVNTEVYIKLFDDHMIPWNSANDESRSYLSNRMVYLRTQAKKCKHTSKSKT